METETHLPSAGSPSECLKELGLDQVKGRYPELGLGLHACGRDSGIQPSPANSQRRGRDAPRAPCEHRKRCLHSCARCLRQLRAGSAGWQLCPVPAPAPCWFCQVAAVPSGSTSSVLLLLGGSCARWLNQLCVASVGWQLCPVPAPALCCSCRVVAPLGLWPSESCSSAPERHR